MRSKESGCTEPWKNIGGGTVLGDDRVHGGQGCGRGAQQRQLEVRRLEVAMCT